MNHNRKLDVLLRELRELAESAQKEDHFKPIFGKLRSFVNNTGPIKYDHSVKYILAIALLISGATYTWLFFTSYELQEKLGWLGFVLITVFLVGVFIPLVMIYFQNDLINDLSDLIFEKDILFDNKLKSIDISDREEVLYSKFYNSFGEFRSRGDEDRKITTLIKGKHQGKEISFDYQYYVFHYVEVYYVPVARTIGKTTTIVMERRTRTCYRYGLNTDFSYRKSVAIVSGGGSYEYPCKWTTESQSFNDIFSVYAQDQMVASKFLPPTVVLAFEEICKYFSDLNLEVNSKGKMNIGFSDDDVLGLKRQYSIANPDAFEKEIGTFLNLPKLKKLLEFIETINKYNDSNF